MGFNLEHIELKKTAGNSEGIKRLLEKEITFFGSRFNAKKKEGFYTELFVLLEAGINLKNALLLIAEENSGKKHSQIFENIIRHLVEGSSFSEALKESGVFSEYEYRSIKIGEETGTLIKVSKELSLFYQRRNEQRKNITNALSYPIIVLATALVSVLFMLRFVVPMFADIFKQNNVELPFITKIVILGSSVIEKYSIWIIIVLVGFFALRQTIRSKVYYQRFKSNFLLRIPVFGELIRKMYLAQFTQALALLSNAKIPILQSIQMTKKMIDFYPLQNALDDVERSILSGESLSQSMSVYKIFDGKMVSLLKVAEETNKNEYIFERLANQYNNEVQYKSKMISTILEPIIILVLGAVVAIILIAMYLPMFKLSTVLG